MHPPWRAQERVVGLTAVMGTGLYLIMYMISAPSADALLRWALSGIAVVLLGVLVGLLRFAAVKFGQPVALTHVVGPALMLGLLGLLVRLPLEASAIPTVIVAGAGGMAALLFMPHLMPIIFAGRGAAARTFSVIAFSGFVLHAASVQGLLWWLETSQPRLLLLIGLLGLLATDREPWSRPQWLPMTAREILRALWPGAVAIGLGLYTRDLAMALLFAAGCLTVHAVRGRRGGAAARAARAALLLSGLAVVVGGLTVLGITSMPAFANWRVVKDFVEHHSITGAWQASKVLGGAPPFGHGPGWRVPGRPGGDWNNVHVLALIGDRLGWAGFLAVVGLLALLVRQVVRGVRDVEGPSGDLALALAAVFVTAAVMPVAVSITQLFWNIVWYVQASPPLISDDMAWFVLVCCALGLIVGASHRKGSDR